MNPTRVIAAPYKGSDRQARQREAWLVPTDDGVIPLAELADVLGLGRETLRKRLMAAPDAWKRPDILKRGHYQVKEYGPCQDKLPRGGIRRSQKSIPVGTWEARL